MKSGGRRGRHGAWRCVGGSFNQRFHHGLLLQSLWEGKHLVGGEWEQLWRYTWLVFQQFAILTQQVEHVVIHILHLQFFLHEFAPSFPNLLCVLWMVVPPLNSMLDRPAFIFITYWPIMLHWHQTSGEEIEVTGVHQQCWRITCQDVFLAHRPWPSFNVNLVSALVSTYVLKLVIHFIFFFKQH